MSQYDTKKRYGPIIYKTDRIVVRMKPSDQGHQFTFHQVSQGVELIHDDFRDELFVYRREPSNG